MKFFVFTLLPGLLENEKKLEKRVSGCNSVAVKTIWKFSRTLGLPYPSLLEVKVFTPTPHASYIYESGLLWHIQQQQVKMAYDVYFFMLKYLYNPLLYIPSICSKLICFKVQMTLTWCSFGLRHPMKKYSNLSRIWIILINLCHF